jgi:hypothetical protein
MDRLIVSITAATAALLAYTNDSNAVTISISSQNTTVIPTTNFVTPPNSFTGPFILSTTGSIANVQRSPYEGTAIPNTPYSVLSAGGTGASSATYNCPSGGCTTLSLLWGSPDGFNFLDFFTGANGGGSLIQTFVGTNLVPPAVAGAGFDQVSFLASAGTFGSVVLRDSGQAAFEFSDVAVPGPIVGAGLPGLVAACGGLLALGRRRRQKVA